MIEILEQLVDFEISDMYKKKRKISFKQPFEDVEFDEYRMKYNKLHLIKDKKSIVKLAFNKDRLEGPDVRGGTAELHPDYLDMSEFQLFFKQEPRKVEIQKTQQEKHTGKIAVISSQNFQDYNSLKPKGRFFDIYNTLFDNGTELVLNFNLPIHESAVKLLVNLSEQYLHGSIGSVQVATMKNGAKPNEVSLETGDWSCFALNLETWMKIKKKMENQDYNFYTNLSDQFKEKRMKRISTNISRTRFAFEKDDTIKDFVIEECPIV